MKKKTASPGNSHEKGQPSQRTVDQEIDTTGPAQDKSPDDMEIFDS